mmetsp:Transcript_26130/g.60339  ORF Transcript_26130/g.60339 Transcript_26130/m.60339 type:complete len:232 (+) Transcript_26130:3227-3922(+)
MEAMRQPVPSQDWVALFQNRQRSTLSHGGTLQCSVDLMVMGTTRTMGAGVLFTATSSSPASILRPTVPEATSPGWSSLAYGEVSGVKDIAFMASALAPDPPSAGTPNEEPPGTLTGLPTSCGRCSDALEATSPATSTAGMPGRRPLSEAFCRPPSTLTPACTIPAVSGQSDELAADAARSAATAAVPPTACARRRARRRSAWHLPALRLPLRTPDTTLLPAWLIPGLTPVV